MANTFFGANFADSQAGGPPHLAGYEDMLSLQWVTVVQKICPTDGLWVSWPAQLVASTNVLVGSSALGTRQHDVIPRRRSSTTRTK